MKIYAVNGSPRKRNNTATLLQSALEGAASEHVQTELIHLYDVEYQSCLSCFSCKRLGGKHYGHCAINDALTPVLEQLAEADGIIFGSPIYYGNITGKMRSFFERLLFPFTVYDVNYTTLSPKQMPTAFLYTMNVSEAQAGQFAYKQNLQGLESAIGRSFSLPETMCAYDTYQFDDYTKYRAERFSEPEKAAHRAQQFPLDCQEAMRIGQNMAHSLLHAVPQA